MSQRRCSSSRHVIKCNWKVAARHVFSPASKGKVDRTLEVCLWQTVLTFSTAFVRNFAQSFGGRFTQVVYTVTQQSKSLCSLCMSPLEWDLACLNLLMAPIIYLFFAPLSEHFTQAIVGNCQMFSCGPHKHWNAAFGAFNITPKMSILCRVCNTQPSLCILDP